MIKYTGCNCSPMPPEGYVLDCTPDPRVGRLLTIAAAGALLISLYSGLYDQSAISLLTLGLLVFGLLDKGRTVSLPDAFQAALVALVYLMVMGAVLVEFPLLHWASNIVLGVILGAAGFILVYGLLQRMPDEGGKAVLMSVLATSFAVAMAVLLEFSEFSLDAVMGWQLQGTLQDSMADLAGVAIGGLLMSVAHFQRRQAGGIFTRMVACFIKVNPQLLGIGDADDQESLMALISTGEGERLEFKSTFRRNTHTGEKDKRMERAVLKTLVAFLNSNGGTLLIGVNDEGEVTGIDLDSFESRDKLGLHFTNIISSQIGNGFLPFISFRLVPVEEVWVLRADCRPSNEPVFLRDGNEEFFYIRSGPSSVEVKGSELVSFIDRRFRS